MANKHKHSPPHCHPREGGDPVCIILLSILCIQNIDVDIDANAKLFNWAPAFAGVTVGVVNVYK